MTFDPSDRKPKRAHELIATFGADTCDGLADELERFADYLRRGQVTAGVSGGPSSGAIYSYSHDPAMTHNAYFEAVKEWLAARAALQEGGGDG